MLEAAAIIAEAEDCVGISRFRPGCPRQSGTAGRLAKPRQWPLGRRRRAHTRHLASDTVNRLEGLKWLRDHPEIADEPIAAPVFLMGLPRSGTTYFQYLFDRDPRFRLIRTWESLTPSPPPGFDHESALRRKAEWAERRRRDLSDLRGFRRAPPYRRGRIGRVPRLSGTEFWRGRAAKSLPGAGLLRLHHGRIGLVETYRIHKRQLQLLQWRSPPRPWALKYPNHVIAMNEILKVYPDARFVMTHRDPIQTLASISKLTFNLRGIRTGNTVDPAQVGSEMMHFVQRHIDRIMEFNRSEQGRRVVHVDCYALVNDPVTALRRIFAGLGIDSPDEVVEGGPTMVGGPTLRMRAGAMTIARTVGVGGRRCRRAVRGLHTAVRYPAREGRSCPDGDLTWRRDGRR